MRDRLSFRRFCGLPLEVETPDHASIWRFRQTIDKLGLSGQLLAEVNRQLEFMLLRFPSEMCSDGGRAINAPDPDWPRPCAARRRKFISDGAAT